MRLGTTPAMVLQALALLFVLALNEGTVDASRIFAATSKNSRLQRRDADFQPRIEPQSLVYGEYSMLNQQYPISALHLSFDPKVPVLSIDDVQSHIASVTCLDEYIDVQFHTPEAMDNARSSWKANQEFVLVTSAPGCGILGEHAAYVVSYFSSHDPANTITLRANSTTLRSCTERLYFDLGSHIVPDVEPRQVPRMAEQQQSQTATVTSNYQTASQSLTSSLSFPAPSASATASSVSGDISFSRLDTKLFPPDSALINLVPHIDAVQGLEIRCRNCSMHGNLELLAAGFSMNSDTVEQAFDFLNDGYFEFTANGVTANMSFDFIFQPGFPVPISVTPQLPKIPLTPFGVPGVLNFGPVLELTFPIEVTLNSVVTFNTGFTLAVPDNSTLLLNVSELSSSYSKGFQNTTLDPLPFNVNASDLSLNFTTAFSPQLILGASAGPKGGPLSVSGGVGAFLDLPRYTATVTAVQNKTDNCVDASSSNEQNTRIHIEPSVSFAGGALWELDVSASGFPPQQRDGEDDLFVLSRSLPAECLLFDSKTSSVIQPGANSSGSKTSDSTSMKQVSVAAAGLFVAAMIFVLY